jgi:hypothetical protein
MKIVGCDLHARQQTIAMVDTETGEFTEKTLGHEGGMAVNARRRFTFWASRCTALAIGKATFGLGCVRKSHACGAR